jgi:hypothetical protein
MFGWTWFKVKIFAIYMKRVFGYFISDVYLFLSVSLNNFTTCTYGSVIINPFDNQNTFNYKINDNLYRPYLFTFVWKYTTGPVSLFQAHYFKEP